MTNQSIPTINHFTALVKLDFLENSIEYLEEIAGDVINDLDLTVVKKFFHNFSPQGTTLLYVLSESHLAIHSWPELATIHFDLVTCSIRSKSEFENSIKASLSKKDIKIFEIKEVIFDNQELRELVSALDKKYVK